MQAPPRFSIIVPARNEEALLGQGLAAIQDAIRRSGSSAEVIVVANRCTDGTEAVATAGGAVVVRDQSRNLAAIRNAGVAAATGEVVVTLDADNLIHELALVEMNRLLDTNRYVGGGCGFLPERNSVGLRATATLLRVVLAVGRIGGVMYWCRRTDFDAIGGFNESRSCAEDLDFAHRLRLHGRRTGRRFINLQDVPVTVSCRKFDTFGDWHMLTLATQARSVFASIKGTDTEFVDRYWYDYET